AALNHARAVALAERLAAVPGVSLVNDTFFNEFTLRLPKPAAGVVERLARKKILAGVPASRLYPGKPTLKNLLLVAATETTTEADMSAFATALARGTDRVAGALGAAGRAALHATLAEELRHRHRDLSAGLLHHEAQPPAQ